jgi:hypothetical protein
VLWSALLAWCRRLGKLSSNRLHHYPKKMKHPYNEIHLNVRRNTLQMYFTFINVRHVYLIEEMNPNGRSSQNSEDEVEYLTMSLEDLIDESTAYLSEESYDGSTSAIVAIMDGVDCVWYENDHSGEENVEFNRKSKYITSYAI